MLYFWHRSIGVIPVPSLASQIMSHAVPPEGALLCPSALLHLGSRAAVDQALSRLARKGERIRVCRGVYVRPIETRFGPRPPSMDKVLASLSALWGETIVPCGGMAANALGLTKQVPVRQVHLTSGPNPQAQARWANGGTALCPTVATSSTAPTSGQCCPRPDLARARGGRGEPGSN